MFFSFPSSILGNIEKDDIINFAYGRKIPSPYWDGIFSYWIGYMDSIPYCFLLTSPVNKDQECPSLWIEHLSKHGQTVTIDFCIGHEDYLGRGLAALTLNAFTDFYVSKIAPIPTPFLSILITIIRELNMFMEKLVLNWKENLSWIKVFLMDTKHS